MALSLVPHIRGCRVRDWNSPTGGSWAVVLSQAVGSNLPYNSPVITPALGGWQHMLKLFGGVTDLINPVASSIVFKT